MDVNIYIYWIIIAILGFAIWERYNIFKKVKSEVVEEINEGKIEKIQKIENSLKEYAKADKKMAIILKNHGLI